MLHPEKKPNNKLYMYSTKIKHACIYSKQQLLNWKLHVLLFLAAGSFIFLAIDILEMDFRQKSVMTLTSNCIYKIKVIAHPVSIGTFWESMSSIELMEEKLCSKEEISGEME